MGAIGTVGRTGGAARGTGEPYPGLAAWLLQWLRTPVRLRFTGIGRARAQRHMELVETLQLGGKRQLMLVECDGQRYLVGAGGDSIHSIAAIASSTQDARIAAIAHDTPVAHDALIASIAQNAPVAQDVPSRHRSAASLAPVAIDAGMAGYESVAGEPVADEPSADGLNVAGFGRGQVA